MKKVPVATERTKAVRKVIEDNPGLNRHEIAAVMGLTVEQIDWGVRSMVRNKLAVGFETGVKNVPVKYYAVKDAHLMPTIDIVAECKLVWAGYRIHKVFGGFAKLGVVNGRLVTL
jgi:hypothetical protein